VSCLEGFDQVEVRFMDWQCQSASDAIFSPQWEPKVQWNASYSPHCLGDPCFVKDSSESCPRTDDAKSYDAKCGCRGRCSAAGSNFTCQCSTRSTGAECQRCVGDYTGLYCMDKPCEPSPCQNNGTCTVTPGTHDMDPTYNCACGDGYTGSQCQDAVVPIF
jgi:hypothetical protein